MLLWVEGVDWRLRLLELCALLEEERVRLLELCTLPDVERELLLAAGCDLLLELLELLGVLLRALELLLEERELLLAAGCDLLLELLLDLLEL